MKSLVFLAVLITTPAFGQTVYKCPAPTPGAPPILQQAPCSPTGGGETIKVKPLPGSGNMISPESEAWRMQRDQERAAKNEAAAREHERQEALDVERAKAKAEAEQAAAQRATARAIWATGWRRY